MEYEFALGKRERAEAALWRMAKGRENRGIRWCLALLLCCLAAGLVFRWGLGWGVPVWMRWKGIGTLVIFWGLMWLVRLWAEYRAVPVARQKVTVGDGLVTHVCGRETRWYVTRNLGEIESGALLLKVQVYDKKGDSHWILVPRSALPYASHFAKFLIFLAEQKEYEGEVPENPGWEAGPSEAGASEAGEKPVGSFTVTWDGALRRAAFDEFWRVGGKGAFAPVKIGVPYSRNVWDAAALGLTLGGIAAGWGMFLAGVSVGVIILLVREQVQKKRPLSDKGYQRFWSRGMDLQEVMYSKFEVFPQGFIMRESMRTLTAPWQEVTKLVETKTWLFLIQKNRWIYMVPRQEAHGEADRAADRVADRVADREWFEEYCKDKCLRAGRRPAAAGSQEPAAAGNQGLWADTDTESRPPARFGKLKVVFAATCVLIVFLVVITWEPPALQGQGEGAFGEAGAATEEETEPYVFHPEDFEGYVPLEKQIGVLRSLGIRVPPSVAETQRQWMEDTPRAREWVEGEPYYEVLRDMGYPEWDENGSKVVSYPDQVYYLDWECYDLAEDYTELLMGVNALSGGEFSLTSPAVYLKDVDQETQAGDVTVYFLLNGNPYLYQLESDGMWLDQGVLRCINMALGAEQAPGRVYALDYEGWGCLLFYRDRKWAGEFAGKTGLSLVMEYGDR